MSICDCGGHKAGYTDGGPGHSAWCCTMGSPLIVGDIDATMAAVWGMSLQPPTPMPMAPKTPTWRFFKTPSQLIANLSFGGNRLEVMLTPSTEDMTVTLTFLGAPRTPVQFLYNGKILPFNSNTIVDTLEHTMSGSGRGLTNKDLNEFDARVTVWLLGLNTTPPQVTTITNPPVYQVVHFGDFSFYYNNIPDSAECVMRSFNSIVGTYLLAEFILDHRNMAIEALVRAISIRKWNPAAWSESRLIVEMEQFMAKQGLLFTSQDTTNLTQGLGFIFKTLGW